MNAAIIGAGGVGGYYGGKLALLLNHEKGLNIFFIARNQHLNEIKCNGLILDTDEGKFVCTPTLATDDISKLPLLDLCMICVKSYDLDGVLMELKSKVKDYTTILPLLNGVDINERIRNRISIGVVLPACVYIGTHIEKPGTVIVRGGAGKIHLGKDPNNDYVNHEIFEFFDKSKIKYSWAENPDIEIWRKYIFIASFGMVTAYSNSTIGQVIQSGELIGHVKDIMLEIYQIAKAKGIILPSTVMDEFFKIANKFPFDAKTSFQRDYENKDKPDERDIFGGTIIRLGEQYGIKTETTRMIYDFIMKNKAIG